MGINDITFEIEGTDIDKASVKIAENGVYNYTDIKTIPMKYLSNHWQRGKGDIEKFVKVKPSLREKCSFRFGNIQELTKELKGKYDIVFCRNVFIYFDQVQIKKISADILKHLQPSGLFFTGVSESLTSLELPIATHGPSIYTHKNAIETETVSKLIADEKVVNITHQPSFY